MFEGVLKVGAGVLAGVGVVVCLPVAGPIGAVTATGALVSGAAGGALGAIWTAFDDDGSYKKGYRKGSMQAHARAMSESEELKKRYEHLQKLFEQYLMHPNAIVALTSLIASILSTEGHLTMEDRDRIKLFVAGAFYESLPQEYLDEIDSNFECPVSLQEAYENLEYCKVPKEASEEAIQFAMEYLELSKARRAVVMAAWNQMENVA